MIYFNEVNMVYDKTKHCALDNVSLKINQGEFVFIVGKSGAGKTTFMKMVLKELTPTSGEIYVANQDITKIKNREVPHYRRKLGVVFQDFRLLTNKTVYDNITFAMEIVGRGKEDIHNEVPKALDQVGLSHCAQHYPDQLSGGEQQRVSIARAIINNPRLIICDEPTGNLDPHTSMDIMGILEKINNNGTTIIMATHDRDIVDKLQKRVITLNGGKIVGDQKGGYHSEDD